VDEEIEKFLKMTSAENIKNYLKDYTQQPHLAGTPESKAVTEYTKEKMKEYGFDVKTDDFEVKLNYPLQRSIVITNPIQHALEMVEHPVPEDPTSNNTNAVPTFNGYAASGNVSGEVIYVNYGRLEDFEFLAANDISVEGKIVLVRYGKIFRGGKVMVAQKYNASGVIIYSDPQDDGFAAGEVYPDGPWRPADGVQRGSVSFLPQCPGAPMNNSRVKSKCVNSNSEFSKIVPSIPVQPISYGDASYLLSNMAGDPVPNSDWQGALNFTYHIGNAEDPDDLVTVDFFLEMNFTTVTLTNVYSTIKGTEKPDEWVVVGNHHDAWVFGAVDPSSGSAVLLETARALGEMMKDGWKPRRSIKFCSWDGEEYALIGSTYYGESRSAELSDKAVAYINVDSAASGTVFGASGTPSLSSLLRSAADLVPFPDNSSVSLLQQWGGNVGVLGSGSDYTVFIDRLGIPSIDMGFTIAADKTYGQYHSLYDSFHWMEKFGDPTFEFNNAIAKMTGILVLELADQFVLPIDFSEYSLELNKYTNQIDQLIANISATFPDENVTVTTQPLKDSIFTLFESYELLEAEVSVILQELESNENYTTFKSLPKKLRNQIVDVNEKLQFAERQFLYKKGLKAQGRPWFRHVVQAPGLYLGYGAETFPGLLTEVRDMDWEGAQEQADIIADRIAKVARTLREGPPSDDYDGPHHAVVITAIVWACLCFVAILIIVILFVFCSFRSQVPTYEILGDFSEDDDEYSAKGKDFH